MSKKLFKRLIKHASHNLGCYETAREAAEAFDYVAVQLDPNYATNRVLGLI